MRIKEYLKQAIQISSLVFFFLVIVNLMVNKELLFNIIEFILFVSLFSGVTIFLMFPKDYYSNRRIVANQLIYISLIFSTIILADIIYKWELGVIGLLAQFMLVLLIFFFIKFIMYSNDKKDAQAMNEQIKQRKKEKS